MSSAPDGIRPELQALLLDIVARRAPAALEYAQAAVAGGALSTPQFEILENTLANELMDEFDDEWEPTKRGHMIEELIGCLVRIRDSESPGGR